MVDLEGPQPGASTDPPPRSGLAGARTMLFVPGDRPDRFEKAVDAGADVVILDLEDAVRPSDKQRARDEVRRWLGTEQRGCVCVRVNAAHTPWYDDDLAVLSGVAGLAGVVLPKAEDPRDAAALHHAVGVPVMAILETARGVVGAARTAEVDGVVRLAWGALDLATDLGTDDADTLGRVRTDLVLASRAAGRYGPVDSVTTDVTDGNVAGRDARAARSVGMRGKLCIHPRQVAPVHAAFAPDPGEVDWAERVLAAGADGGVSTVDGVMIDAPVIARARGILAEAQR